MLEALLVMFHSGSGVRDRKRSCRSALQDAGATAKPPRIPPGFGVRRSSGAFLSQSTPRTSSRFGFALIPLLVLAATAMFAQTSKWQLVWSDEFNGPTINRTNW